MGAQASGQRQTRQSVRHGAVQQPETLLESSDAMAASMLPEIRISDIRTSQASTQRHTRQTRQSVRHGAVQRLETLLQSADALPANTLPENRSRRSSQVELRSLIARSRQQCSRVTEPLARILASPLATVSVGQSQPRATSQQRRQQTHRRTIERREAEKRNGKAERLQHIVAQLPTWYKSQTVCSPPDECAICLEEFLHGDCMTGLHCGHAYHQSCVVEWLGRVETCPHCRAPVGQDGKQQEAAAQL